MDKNIKIYKNYLIKNKFPQILLGVTALGMLLFIVISKNNQNKSVEVDNTDSVRKQNVDLYCKKKNLSYYFADTYLINNNSVATYKYFTDMVLYRRDSSNIYFFNLRQNVDNIKKCLEIENQQANDLCEKIVFKIALSGINENKNTLGLEKFNSYIDKNNREWKISPPEEVGNNINYIVVFGSNRISFQFDKEGFIYYLNQGESPSVYNTCSFNNQDVDLLTNVFVETTLSDLNFYGIEDFGVKSYEKATKEFYLKDYNSYSYALQWEEYELSDPLKNTIDNPFTTENAEAPLILVKYSPSSTKRIPINKVMTSDNPVTRGGGLINSKNKTLNDGEAVFSIFRMGSDGRYTWVLNLETGKATSYYGY